MAAAGRGDGGGGGKHAADQPLPADATAIRNILKTMGVEAHEPRVMNQLLDFMYSYVSGVLSDASAFAEQVGPPNYPNVARMLSTQDEHVDSPCSAHLCWQ